MPAWSGVTSPVAFMCVGPDRSQRGWSTSGTAAPKGSWWRQVAASWGAGRCCGCLQWGSAPGPLITYPQATLYARSEMSGALCCGVSSLGAIRSGPPRLGQDEEGLRSSDRIRVASDDEEEVEIGRPAA